MVVPPRRRAHADDGVVIPDGDAHPHADGMQAGLNAKAYKKGTTVANVLQSHLTITADHLRRTLNAQHVDGLALMFVSQDGMDNTQGKLRIF